MPGLRHNFIQNYLHEQFLTMGINCVAEYSEGDRRTDLYLLRDKIAIEVQTSPITIKEIESRNQDWLEVGVKPVWVFGSHKFIRYYDGLMYLNKTLRSFIDTGFYIFERRVLYRINPVECVKVKTVDTGDWVLELPLFSVEKEAVELEVLTYG